MVSCRQIRQHRATRHRDRYRLRSIPMSQDQYTDYNNQPQNPYQHEPLQNPHETSQGSYTTPPLYGYRQQQNHGQQQQSYASPPPQATPLPLEQAIKELP